MDGPRPGVGGDNFHNEISFHLPYSLCDRLQSYIASTKNDHAKPSDVSHVIRLGGNVSKMKSFTVLLMKLNMICHKRRNVI